MWSDADAIIVLILGFMGGIAVLLILLARLEDNLDPARPRGLRALRAWWRSTSNRGAKGGS
ncbi:hypothetical protein [Actinopolymorpha alba]|uniref:hypothetical protein n=1 Tax=Actinopolymorpha alba TaxID=533267 RepID=UPI0003720B9B|nr:hypothetical protein [Actinopolymorpha alba]